VAKNSASRGSGCQTLVRVHITILYFNLTKCADFLIATTRLRIWLIPVGGTQIALVH